MKPSYADIAAARDLLAVIHGDGGHYTETFGFAKSCRDAESAVVFSKTIIATSLNQVKILREMLKEECFTDADIDAALADKE